MIIWVIGADQCKRQRDIPPRRAQLDQNSDTRIGMRINAFKNWHEAKPNEALETERDVSDNEDK